MAEEFVVVLRCFDGAELAVSASLARARSGLVAAAASGAVVDVPGNVSGGVVAEVVAYWEGRAAAADAREFDSGFVGGLRHDARIDLIHAAHHIGDEGLFNLIAAQLD